MRARTHAVGRRDSGRHGRAVNSNDGRLASVHAWPRRLAVMSTCPHAPDGPGCVSTLQVAGGRRGLPTGARRNPVEGALCGIPALAWQPRLTLPVYTELRLTVGRVHRIIASVATDDTVGTSLGSTPAARNRHGCPNPPKLPCAWGYRCREIYRDYIHSCELQSSYMQLRVGYMGAATYELHV